MNTIFAYVNEAEKQNDRAKLTELKCSITDCPVLAEGKCINRNYFGHCIYGTIHNTRTSTKRSKSYQKELLNLKEIANKNSKYLDAYNTECITKIGQLLKNSYLFTSGCPFVKQEDFNVDFVLKASSFRPYALMCGEITSYQY